ncbi:hypothetical protein B0H21DRAFT_747805 [Amylocystis lapponica]|nr:hypothetical protein B0H21DRAFT_747805 [Amylocystis lapponica]
MSAPAHSPFEPMVSRILSVPLACRLNDGRWMQQAQRGYLEQAYLEYQKCQAPSREATPRPDRHDQDAPLAAAQHAHKSAILIPQRLYEPPNRNGRGFQTLRPIKFSVNGCGHIALSDALAGRFGGLEHANDLVFSDGALKKSLRLEWPMSAWGRSYASYSRQITVRDSTKEDSSITVAKLARKIAEELKRFIELNQNFVLEDTRWKVGRESVTLDRLLLVEARQVSEGSIQPVLWLQL